MGTWLQRRRVIVNADSKTAELGFAPDVAAAFAVNDALTLNQVAPHHCPPPADGRLCATDPPTSHKSRADFFEVTV
jgi:hypothetical protein